MEPGSERTAPKRRESGMKSVGTWIAANRLPRYVAAAMQSLAFDSGKTACLRVTLDPRKTA
jgi:hypothetical protein